MPAARSPGPVDRRTRESESPCRSPARARTRPPVVPLCHGLAHVAKLDTAMQCLGTRVARLRDYECGVQPSTEQAARTGQEFEMSNQQVSLNLLRVKCVDETGGSWAERIGNDEIWLAGSAVDATGQPVKLAPFEVYPHFDDGDIKEFSPPKTLFTLNVPGGGTFPKYCQAILLLAEKDSGDLTKLAQDAFDKVTKDMEETKTETGMGEGDQPPPDFWDKVEEILKEVTYGYIKDEIAAGLNDDVFPAQTVSLSITSDDFRWGDGTKESPEVWIQFDGHGGRYALACGWVATNVVPRRPPLGGEVPVGGVILHQ